MLTLRQFAALIDSYGADPGRWPEAVRADAEELLRVSAEARRLLAVEQDLDDAIGGARANEDAATWPPGHQSAALARLRAGVVTRIGVSRARPSVWRLGWLRMATASGLLIAVGLLIGASDVASPAPSDVFTMLQPDPLPFLADE